jgi:hypothetical protein
MPLFSHFFPLFNTIGMALITVNNAYWISVVVQGLRDDLVAQKGRIMAVFALAKSVAYRDFLDESIQVSRKKATVAVSGHKF